MADTTTAAAIQMAICNIEYRSIIANIISSGKKNIKRSDILNWKYAFFITYDFKEFMAIQFTFTQSLKYMRNRIMSAIKFSIGLKAQVTIFYCIF